MCLRRFLRILLGPSLLVLAGGLLLISCKPESGPGTLHPVEARIPHFDDPDRAVRTESPSDEKPLPQLRAAWETPTHTIGVKDGRGPELFGRIRDVHQNAEGRIFVLDYENKEVRVFGPRGTHHFSYGREGEGPGEFQYPSQLDMLEDGTLMVAGRSGRVQFFTVSPDSLARTQGFTVEFTPEDACVLNGEIYLQGTLAEQPNHSIHVYSRAGTRKRSLGPVYQSDNEFVRQGITDGHVVCDRSANTVVFGFSLAPILYGYHPQGRLQWTTRLRPFDPMPVEQGVGDAGTTSMRYRSEPGTDRLSGLVDLPGSGILAQRHRSPPDDTDRANAPLFTYRLSARDGSGAHIGTSPVDGAAAGPITHVSTTHLFSARPVPFPQVDVYDLREVEWAVEQ